MPDNPTISSKERSSFIRDARALFEKHQKFAGRVALAEIPKEPPEQELKTPVLHIGISKTKTRQCVKYGIDPMTGERICIHWVESA